MERESDEVDRWELTDKAIEAEWLADSIAKRFWIDREEVFDLIVGEETRKGRNDDN